MPRVDTALSVTDLHVHRGTSHVVQGVEITVGTEPVAVLGRNGMGKTTLCEALMGLLPPTRGRVCLFGEDITGRKPHHVAAAGIGYVPQGRKLFPSLTVQEHLRLVQRTVPGRRGWSIDELYDVFPRLADRRAARGDQLSGGEQQMLAVARALITGPRLLIMDEPSEGLAPAVVTRLVAIIHDLVNEGIGLLLVEQSLPVAVELAPRIAIMVTGRIVDEVEAATLGADETLQHRYLGVGTKVEGAHDR